MFAKHRKTLGAALIVAGTAIGAAMLALPVVTSQGGLFPAICIYFLTWIIMTATGLLLSEMSLRLPAGTNLITMANQYLGNFGKIFSWVVFLFLCYCISIAYLAKGGDLLREATGNFLSPTVSTFLFLLIFGTVVYLGAKTVDRINSYLMIGLIISYLLFIFLGIKHINFSYYVKTDWSAASLALPIILASFGYQVVVPSLTDYLDKDKGKIRFAIIFGTTFALVIYLFWEILIRGILPIDVLAKAKMQGDTAIQPLKNVTNIKAVYGIGQFFSFFAITTSFLGVALALFDFLADGLKLAKQGVTKIFLAVLTFIPPLIITLFFPNIFIIALGYAGGIGVNLLFIFLPAWMAWKAHYILKDKFLFSQLPKEKFFLIAIFAFCLMELIVEIIVEVQRIVT